MNASTQLLANKTAFVTGAGANIGRSIALEMADQGADVYFADIDWARCETLEQEILALGRKSKGFVVDLSREKEIDALFTQLANEGIAVDTLINNVGIPAKKTMDVTHWWEEWRHVYDTNVIGPSYLTKLVVDSMIQNKISGSVLFITSMHQWTVRGDAAYSSSKAALGMIVRELAMQLAPHNIRVNGIAPGYVAEDEKGQPHPHPYTPLGKSSIPPCYIGRAAVYLCAEYFSKRTTGSILTLDSGLYLTNHLTQGAPPAPSPLRRVARKLRQATRR